MDQQIFSLRNAIIAAKRNTHRPTNNPQTSEQKIPSLQPQSDTTIKI